MSSSYLYEDVDGSSPAEAEEAQPSGEEPAADAADARDSSAEPAAEPVVRQGEQQCGLAVLFHAVGSEAALWVAALLWAFMSRALRMQSPLTRSHR